MLVVSFVFGLLIGGIAAAAADDSQAVEPAVTFLVTVGASAVTTPIFAVIISVLYFDQRVRKEGFDLQLLAQGVGAEGYPTASQPTGSSRSRRRPSPAGSRLGRAAGREAGGAPLRPTFDRYSPNSERKPAASSRFLTRRS